MKALESREGNISKCVNTPCHVALPFHTFCRGASVAPELAEIVLFNNFSAASTKLISCESP